MTTPHSPRRTDLRRMTVLYGTLGCALAWGLVELLALQRTRYQRWRMRLLHR